MLAIPCTSDPTCYVKSSTVPFSTHKAPSSSSLEYFNSNLLLTRLASVTYYHILPYIVQICIIHMLSVMCLILPWLQMRRESQLSQLQALSFEVLSSCAYCVAAEAHVPLSQKNRRTKAALSDFIVRILRTSLRDSVISPTAVATTYIFCDSGSRHPLSR